MSIFAMLLWIGMALRALLVTLGIRPHRMWQFTLIGTFVNIILMVLTQHTALTRTHCLVAHSTTHHHTTLAPTRTPPHVLADNWLGGVHCSDQVEGRRS